MGHSEKWHKPAFYKSRNMEVKRIVMWLLQATDRPAIQPIIVLESLGVVQVDIDGTK